MTLFVFLDPFFCEIRLKKLLFQILSIQTNKTIIIALIVAYPHYYIQKNH